MERHHRGEHSAYIPPLRAADSELRAANSAILVAGLRAQQAADDSQRAYLQLESLLSGLDEGLLIIGAAGNLVFVNAAARRILRLPPARARWEAADSRAEEARDAGYGKPIPAESLPMQRAIRGEEYADYEIVFDPAGGLPHQHVLFSSNSIEDDSGEVLAIVTCRDVTRLRELERMRDDFTALVSHDLRNPLAIIVAAAERLGRLRTRQTDEEMEETVGLVRQSAQRMLAMIGQLVDMSALESGGMRAEHEPVSIVPLVRRVARSTGIPVYASSEVPIILGDEAMIERVLVNLVTNAIKYSAPQSPVSIDIKTRQDEVVVSVSDAGRGIALADQKVIFERFQRVPDSAVGRPGGYGLGLYISRLIVEAHGGHIWVQSTPNAGSTFSFSLPARASN